MSSRTRMLAEKELFMLVKSTTDPDDRPIVEPFIPEILELVDKFGNSGQSGGSAPFVAYAIADTVKKLCLQQSICPITGNDDEWVDVADLSDGDPNTLYQNKRCGGLFKDSKGKAWYLDAIVWENEDEIGTNGSALTSSGEKILSRQYVKSFPFTPKIFYIKVTDKEINKDDWEHFITDEEQLKEVFEYYEKY